MKPSFKKFGIPFMVFIAGAGILGITWWVNGAEMEDVWLYAMAIWFVLYAAYELYSGLSKRKD